MRSKDGTKSASEEESWIKSDMLEKKDESINKLQEVQQLEESVQALYEKQR